MNVKFFGNSERNLPIALPDYVPPLEDFLGLAAAPKKKHPTRSRVEEPKIDPTTGRKYKAGCTGACAFHFADYSNDGLSFRFRMAAQGHQDLYLSDCGCARFWGDDKDRRIVAYNPAERTIDIVTMVSERHLAYLREVESVGSEVWVDADDNYVDKTSPDCHARVFSITEDGWHVYTPELCMEMDPYAGLMQFCVGSPVFFCKDQVAVFPVGHPNQKVVAWTIKPNGKGTNAHFIRTVGEKEENALHF